MVRKVLKRASTRCTRAGLNHIQAFRSRHLRNARIRCIRRFGYGRCCRLYNFGWELISVNPGVGALHNRNASFSDLSDCVDFRIVVDVEDLAVINPSFVREPDLPALCVCLDRLLQASLPG